MRGFVIVIKSDTNIYQGGNFVLLARTGLIICTFKLLSRYVEACILL